jgi:hypothetical protein
MALDDLTLRSYALPVRLVNTVIFKGGGAAVASLREAASEGLKHLDERFFKESSTKILQELADKLDVGCYSYDGYGVYEVTMTRRLHVILRLTAKEYSKSADELLTLCLIQHLTR